MSPSHNTLNPIRPSAASSSISERLRLSAPARPIDELQLTGCQAGKHRLGLLLLFLAVGIASAQSTNIAIGTTALQPSVKRLGINLGTPNYWDSGQMLKNLINGNPGFEGQMYQSTIQCASGTATSCLDSDQWSTWPASYWNNASYQFLYGAANGRTGTIKNYTAAANGQGGTFTLSNSGTAPANGDWMVVSMMVPGNAAAGWWPSTSGNGAISTNTTDLPAGTTGTQTVALSASTASDSATLASYFDGTAGKSFIQLNGAYQLSFKAKGTGGTNSISVSVARYGTTSTSSYLNQTIVLTNSWQTYNLSFSAAESGTAVGTVGVTFATVGQDSFYMDDASLVQTNSDPTNTTAFRDPVVTTLQTLNPGVMRFWAGQLGDTLDNLIAGPYARKPSGYSAWSTDTGGIAYYDLYEFLQLSQTIGAEPWFVVPITFSTTDAANLIEFLAGASTTPYGAKRAARGQASPWTQSFNKIHLEFGNEAWNSTFEGGIIDNDVAYGNRAQTIFAAMRADPAYVASSFDLVLGGQAVSSWRNQDIQNNCNNNDSFAVAPYMMNQVNTYDTTNLFESTFAEPEAYMVSTGVAEGVTGGMMLLNQQAIQASSHPVPLALYEMNLSTLSGSITQSALNSYVSSLGAGLAVVDSMLQQMRQGVITQNLFALPQYEFGLPDGETAFLWGAVVDMGVTNLKRPQYLALQLANQALSPGATMLQTVQSGANPTWNQALVNSVQLNGAHYLQSFAFANGNNRSTIIFNLNLSSPLPVTFSGSNAPQGAVQIQQLTSGNPTDTNETSAVVVPTTTSVSSFNPASPLSLPPYSMTVLTWQDGQQ